MTVTQRSMVFVCGTPHGGAVDSTAALVALARAAGHPVDFLVAAGDAYVTNRRLVTVLVRVRRYVRALGDLGWRWYERRYGARVECSIRDVAASRAVDVVGAARAAVGAGTLVVANSLRRLDLDRLVELSSNADASLVWYLREESALQHAADVGPVVDVMLANSRPLAVAAAECAGRRCAYVPSVITVDDLVEPAARRALLVVNPVASHGLDEAMELAAAMPDHLVVLQESWPFSDAEVAALEARCANLPNVEFRRTASRSEVYRDAAVLLLPHSAEVVGMHRPRVALEAQFLGVPALAYDCSGLAAVTASTELRVPVDASIDEWVRRIRLVEAEYERFSSEARTFARAELQSPAALWARFASEAGLS